jgi:hypothetical protein
LRTGLADPSLGINILRGGAVRYMNQAFGTSGRANEGSTTILPSANDWAFHCTRYANLSAQGVTIDRTWGHDPQAWQTIMSAGKERVADAILMQLDAAALYGIKCIITLGGFSDPNTCSQAYSLFDLSSQDYQRFVELAAFVADKISGHPALEVLELLNEPDYMHVIKGYWLPRYPAGRMELLNAFAVWQDGMISAVKGRQSRKGTPLGMGTAMDSTLYCDVNGNGAMPWGTAECINEIIPRMAAGCDVWTPHVYLGQNDQVHRDVLFGQKFPSFAQAAKKAGKRLVLGETGALYYGGIYDAQMSQVLDDLGVDRCWMIRWWDPTKYTVPSIPTRIPYSPAPVETPTETPVEPSPDSSSPAQEPPDEPGEPAEPQEPAVEEPSGEKPSEETPEGGEPANEAPSDPPEADETPSEPSPETGRGLVLVQVVRRIIELMIRMFKRKR